MTFEKLSIEGLIVITPKVFEDERGYFQESYNKKVFEENGININFVQDNTSKSAKNVLRGMHYQMEPFAQDKLVRVTQGSVLDVAVDIRKDSPTFGKHEMVELSADNHKMFLVPKGFAHGFLVLSDIVVFEYKTSNFYSKESDRGLRFDDPALDIEWPVKRDQLILSEKDKEQDLLADIPKSELF